MPRWTPMLLAGSLAALALWLVAAPPPAHADENYGPIASAALAAVGRVEGQCFTWMQRTVLAATGKRIGFDYRHGYLDAGATEVSTSEARNGDIIQIANDADTSAWADYPGLHSAIVIDNYGDGRFRVVDSNSQWDGVVRIRDGYSPAAAAGRYAGLSYRIYRLEGEPPLSGAANDAVATETTVTAAAVAPPPPALTVGATVSIAADGDCLRVRSGSSTSSSVIGCLPTGAPVTIMELGPESDGFRWVQIRGGGLTGWVAANYLGAAVTPPVATGTAAPRVVAAPTSSAGVSFLTAPIFGTGGMAPVVFMGGTVEQLRDLAGQSGATGVWAQNASGEFHLLLVGGPAFMLDAFRSKFSDTFNGPTAVTLVSAPQQG